MSTKDLVLACLEGKKGDYISGSAIAAEIGVGRNAVWKAVQSLCNQGYTIESVTGRGYRLSAESDILSAAAVSGYLHTPGIAVEFHQSIDSTNTRAKALGAAGCPHKTLVVASAQTAGKGRQGRSFFSPPGTGVYFSLVIRPSFSLEDVSHITSYAAVCVARALEQVYGASTQIKWVNDVFCNGSKCCGILTEASLCAETGQTDYVVVGIGINVSAPAEGFPSEVAGVAGGLDARKDGASRAQLVARVVDLFFEDYERIPQRPHLEEYRKRSLLDGRKVRVYEGRSEYDACVLGINDDFTLRVRLADGTEHALTAGEVHIPSSQLGAPQS